MTTDTWPLQAWQSTASLAPARAQSSLLRVLAVLLAADLAIVVLDVLYQVSDNLFGILLPQALDMNLEWTLGPILQHGKELAIVGLLFLIWRHLREPIFAAWFVAWGYFLADDTLALHEAGAKLLVADPDAVFMGARMQAYGEVAYAAIVCIVLLSLVAVAHRRSGSRSRGYSLYFLGLWLGIGFLGVFIDLIAAMDFNVWISEALGYIEDGGEMVLMSLSLWFTASLLLRIRAEADDS